LAVNKKSLNSVYSVLLLLLVAMTYIKPAGAEMIADGLKLTVLTDDGRSKAVAWAWHGDLVSFIRSIPGSSQNQLFIMKSDGSGKQVVSPIGNTFFAEWSWGGDKLSYLFTNADADESQGGAFIYDLSASRSYPVSAPYLRKALDPDEGPIWSAGDRYLSYKVRPGDAQLRQEWIYDIQSKEMKRILSEFTEVHEGQWNRRTPDRLCVKIIAPNGWDLATVEPDGTGMTRLTDVGAQSLEPEGATWSPVEECIAFLYGKDMTQQERELERADCWLINSDGKEARNMTTATSQATEKQLKIDDLYWSWDGRWILAKGERFDNQGNEIETLYMINRNNGGYQILLTSYPQEKSEIENFEAVVWSYDSTKIALLSKRQTVRNWGPDAAYEQAHTVLSIYDIKSDTRTDLLIYSNEQDRKRLLGENDRDTVEDISWSPDNRSLLVTIAKIISETDNVLQPDVYRVDLPASFISAQAAANEGPPMGRGQKPIVPAAKKEQPASAEKPAKEIAEETIKEPVKEETTAAAVGNGIIIETIKPQHISIEEILTSLPSKYKQYLTGNIAQNMLIYEGPADVWADFLKHFNNIDQKSPQILVDLLAVELTDEANRELGLDWTYSQGGIGFLQPMGNTIRRPITPSVLGDGQTIAPFDSTVWNGLQTASGAGQAFYQGVGHLPHEFFIRLNALISDGKGSILANPRTVATSGQEAVIQIRKTLNYFFNEGFDDAGRPIVKKSDISADTQGRIVPTLLADNCIRMIVDIKVGSFTFSPDAGLPEQTNRESTTTVTVREGQTLVIGGLRQQEMSQSVTKVPFMGDLPIIGALFKNTKKDEKNTVLTLFVTPHLLAEDGAVPPWPRIDGNDQKIEPIMSEPNSSPGWN
jgi:type II secretory pathway component GspD/PulD (secretin)